LAVAWRTGAHLDGLFRLREKATKLCVEFCVEDRIWLGHIARQLSELLAIKQNKLRPSARQRVEKETPRDNALCLGAIPKVFCESRQFGAPAATAGNGST
jgi:hypothetical protein